MSIKEKFLDWTKLDFEPCVYDKRRQRLLKLLEKEEAVMLIPARVGPGPNTFRQNDNFNYFTGLELPESVLVADAKDGIRLYMPHTDVRFSSPARPNDFPGRDLLDDPAVWAFCGIADLRPFEEFDAFLDSLKGRTIYLPMPDQRPLEALSSSYFFQWDGEQGFAYHLLRQKPQLTFLNGFELCARLRMVKDPQEIEAIQRAIRITEQSILATLPLVKPGVDERTLIGRLEDEFRRLGAQRVAFDSIVKGGKNAHYAWRILGSHYDRRNQILQEGDVVVFDVGAEWNHYTSDIGRTFPVGKHFTPKQFDRLERVRTVVEAIRDAIRPGILLGDLREIALKHLEPSHHQYMQVDSYYGHHIGLSAGDPSLLEAPLQTGMVFTIEPWYYNHDENVSVFTEENIVVTQDGARVLSDGIPIDAGSLERLKNM